MIPSDRLAELGPFSALESDVRALIAERLNARPFASGEMLFAEGEDGDKLYFLTTGRVGIQKTLDAAKKTFKTVAVMGPGDFFGEMALLEKAPRSASAVALTDGEALTLASQDVSHWLGSDARLPLRFLLPFLTTLSARLRETTGEMAVLFEVGRLLVEDLDNRELGARLLTVLAQPYGDEVPAAIFLWSPYSREYESGAGTGGWPNRFLAARPATDALFHWMSEKGECLISPDWEADARFPENVRAAWPEFKSLLAAPIPGPSGPVGFVIFGHGQEKGFFSAGHRRTLAGVANLVAPAFESGAMREERRAEERLKRGKLR